MIRPRVAFLLQLWPVTTQVQYVLLAGAWLDALLCQRDWENPWRPTNG